MPEPFTADCIEYPLRWTLQVHDVVEYSGRLHRVSRVNDCSARITPVKRNVRVVTPKTGRDAGKTLVFEEESETFPISARSELAVIGHWDHVRETVLFKGGTGDSPVSEGCQPEQTAAPDNGKPADEPFEQQTLL